MTHKRLRSGQLAPACLLLRRSNSDLFYVDSLTVMGVPARSFGLHIVTAQRMDLFNIRALSGSVRVRMRNRTDGVTKWSSLFLSLSVNYTRMLSSSPPAIGFSGDRECCAPAIDWRGTTCPNSRGWPDKPCIHRRYDGQERSSEPS
jgi:hypothetical protein